MKSAIKVNNIPPRLQVSVSIPFIKDEAAAFVVNFCSKNPNSLRSQFEDYLRATFQVRNHQDNLIEHLENIHYDSGKPVMPVEKTLENAMRIATIYDNCIFKNRKNDHQDHQIISNKVSNRTNKYCKECKTKTHNTVECRVRKARLDKKPANSDKKKREVMLNVTIVVSMDTTKLTVQNRLK